MRNLFRARKFCGFQKKVAPIPRFPEFGGILPGLPSGHLFGEIEVGPAEKCRGGRGGVEYIEKVPAGGPPKKVKKSAKSSVFWGRFPPIVSGANARDGSVGTHPPGGPGGFLGAQKPGFGPDFHTQKEAQKSGFFSGRNRIRFAGLWCIPAILY